eukprot:TRINITY_DN21824_c0_g1_i2.p4 TRINITY_DN21824_c0_g1~~TRINITY_DN21824_c0_g1_i2.p4  ORF type:complete len:101 (+),score=7.33 TRINITY_DN21824_c0_g1_i2:458-760(+)
MMILVGECAERVTLILGEGCWDIAKMLVLVYELPEMDQWVRMGEWDESVKLVQVEGYGYRVVAKQKSVLEGGWGKKKLELVDEFGHHLLKKQWLEGKKRQ